jgi:hypothetical protein
MGSSVHQTVHEGKGQAGLGRASTHEEEEADVAEERRRS